MWDPRHLNPRGLHGSYGDSFTFLLFINIIYINNYVKQIVESVIKYISLTPSIVVYFSVSLSIYIDSIMQIASFGSDVGLLRSKLARGIHRVDQKLVNPKQ
jgi:hypothetical protein